MSRSTTASLMAARAGLTGARPLVHCLTNTRAAAAALRGALR